MYPILLTIGSFHLYSYGLCMATAFAVGIYLIARDLSKYLVPELGLKREEIFQSTFDLFSVIIPVSLIGARIWFVLENHQLFTGSHWIQAFYIWQGGLVWYGGLLGAFVAGFFWLKHKKWPIAKVLDLTAPYVLLGQGIGRIGCFLNGCCYGVVSAKYGMIFPAIGDNLPHLPTELYEMVGDFALFGLMLLLRKKTIQYAWWNICFYSFTYGVLRYILECYRRNGSKHYLIYFLSPSQAFSFFQMVIFGILVGWISCYHLWFKKNHPALEHT